VKRLLNDYISACLVEQPVDVFDFARKYFKGSATMVEDDGDADAMSGGAPGDQDDLDDMVNEASSPEAIQLRAYLQKVFESIDVDGSGEISKRELEEKLKQDTELQGLLEASGGSGDYFVLEQLDLDGDGSVTWAEFESMLGTT